MTKAKDSTLLIISHKKHVYSNGGYFVRGGFGAIKNTFAKEFKKIKLCVPVVKDHNVEPNHKYASNIEVIPLPHYNGRYELIKSLPEISKKINKEIKKADYVYSMAPNDMGVIGVFLSRIGKKKTFISLDTDRAERALIRSKTKIRRYFVYYFNKIIIYNIIKLFAKNRPAFVTGNMYMGEYKHWYQWVKSTFTREELMPFSPNENSQDKKDWNITFAGRLSYEKNIFSLIDACGISEFHNQITLNIIGEGNLKESISEYCKKEKFFNVRLKGYMNNRDLVNSKFSNADIFVLPSKEERQGKVLLEAMQCSIPVIASNAGGIPAVITDRSNGLLFDPNSTKDLASKIDLLIKDKELNTLLKKNGYEYAKEHTLDSEVEKIVEVIENFYLK